MMIPSYARISIATLLLITGMTSLAIAEEARFHSFDRVFEGIVQDLKVPGVSVAVARNGRLVFAQGYGMADKEEEAPVSVNSLFRIASISKPITAVAVLQLAERGKLDLEDPVFEVLDYAAEMEAVGDTLDHRIHEVTIRQLLQHRGGWDRDVSFDPMFRSVRFAEALDLPPPASPDTVIRAMLRYPLDFDPGTRYAYSNFGYCLLGRVIETVSQLDYETYVQREVLHPLGIQHMRIGGTRSQARVANEVRYYHRGQRPSVFASDLHQSVPAPYGAWYLEAMDSHGGWIATASDLAKFGSAFDDPEHCPILSAKSIQQMYSPPASLAASSSSKASSTQESSTEEPSTEESAAQPSEGTENDYYYSLGWSNRIVGGGKINHWHSGSLPGTATILIRRHDGLTLVALVNSRQGSEGKNVGRAIDRALHRAANGVTQWD